MARRYVFRSAACGLSLLLTAALSRAATPQRIIDGSPRIFVNGRQWSWGIGMNSSMCKGVGITNWKFRSSDTYCNTIPVTDSLKLEKNPWTNNIDFRSNDTPVVMMIYATCVNPSSANDMANINLGARKLLLLADTLKGRGVDWVFYTTRHRREMRWRNQCGSADDWFDTCVIKEYSRLAGKQLHADLMTTSIAYYPHTVVSDLEHPAGPLEPLYNTRWLQALYLHDGATPPAKLESDLVTSYTNEVNKRKQLGIEVTAPADRDTIRIGQSMTVRVSIDTAMTGKSTAYIHLIGYMCAAAGQFKIGLDSVSLTKTRTTFTFTIPDSAPVYMYATGRNMYPLHFDSAQIQVMLNPNSWNKVAAMHVSTRKFFIAGRDGAIPSGVQVHTVARKCAGRGRAAYTIVRPDANRSHEGGDLLGRIVRPIAFNGRKHAFQSILR